jgi:hypothetical protein
MSQRNILWWQKYGTVGQIGQAVVALFGFIAILVQISVLGKNAHEAGTVTEPVYLTTYSAETQRWIAAELQKSCVTGPDCKLRKT